MMTFTPKTAQELAQADLWPAGNYDFEVIKADMAASGPASKNPGTPYIKLGLKIWDEQGDTRLIFGMLHPGMESMVRHFCEATGLLGQYNSGRLDPQHCVGKVGKLKLKIAPASGNFSAKNEVADFLDGVDKAPVKVKPAVDDDDDLPM